MEGQLLNFLGSSERSELQISDIDKIKSIIQENQLLNNLTNKTVKQILVSLKISLGNIKETELGLQKIKEKLIDIILDEKEQCVNYLMLPKFQNLSEPSKSTLKQVLWGTWQEFRKQCEEKEKFQKYSMLFCRSKNSKQIQQFHVRLLNFFKMNFISFTQQLYTPLLGGYPQLVNNQTPNQFQGNQQFSQYPGNMILPNQQNLSVFPLFASGNVKIQEVQQQRDYQQQMCNRLSNQMFQNSSQGCGQKNYFRGSGEEGEMQSNRNNKITNFDIFSIIKEEGNDFQNHHFASQILSRNENSLKNGAQSERKNSYKKQFTNCPCKGKLQNVGLADQLQNYFECDQCGQKLHLNCLRLPQYAKKKVQTKSLCPLCLLKMNNIFYCIIGEPIESMWIEQANLPKTKINIKGKKLKDILDNNYTLQLRFLRATGKNMLVLQDQNPNKIKPSSHFHEIIIEDSWLRKNGQDIKIALDYLTPANKNLDSNKKNQLIYIALFMSRRKTQEEILNMEYQFFEADHLKKTIQREGKQKVSINIMDNNFNLIENPVRGIDCYHTDVFSLRDLTTSYIEFKSQKCPICQKKCSNLKIDRTISNQIEKIKLQANGNYDIIPSTITYYRSGIFQWAYKQNKTSIRKNDFSQQQDDISLSMGNIQEQNAQNQDDQ